MVSNKKAETKNNTNLLSFQFPSQQPNWKVKQRSYNCAEVHPQSKNSQTYKQNVLLPSPYQNC